MKKNNNYQEFKKVLKILLSLVTIQNQRIQHMKNESLKLYNPNYTLKTTEESKIKKQIKEEINQLQLTKKK